MGTRHRVQLDRRLSGRVLSLGPAARDGHERISALVRTSGRATCAAIGDLRPGHRTSRLIGAQPYNCWTACRRMDFSAAEEREAVADCSMQYPIEGSPGSEEILSAC